MMFVSARVASQMRRLARTWTHETSSVNLLAPKP
jgi:hypothetical protein